MSNFSYTRSSLTLNQLQLINNPGSVETSVYYIGVDVGTGSARAVIVDNLGHINGQCQQPIIRQELKPNYITQSTTEIWNSIVYCVRNVIRESGVNPADVIGIGFDATCSLAVIHEKDDSPFAVGPDFTNHDQNIILWMDHRAVDETNEINASGDKCLKYVGGKMSIEMELPKIKWLKNNLPTETFKKAKFYDLADFLTHKATGSEARSYCSTVCKQGFVPPGVDGSVHGWSREFLEKINLPELVEDNFRRLGKAPGLGGEWLSAGEKIGPLSKQAAEDLGLTTECVVASGVIDAYAGWVGTVAAQTDVKIDALARNDQIYKGMDRASGRLAAVAGTSTCHIALSKEAIFVEGVWGPYLNALAPGFWLAEGGQSCTGALLAHVLNTHPHGQQLSQIADASGISRFDILNSNLERLLKERNARSVVALSRHLFFYGDYHGNRSPIADPEMRASIIGQSMDASMEDLAITYLGACEFIAQQTRHIIEKMNESGHKITSIFMSGGQCTNGLLMRLLADCTGIPVVIPHFINDAVVFGAALLGAAASQETLRKRVAVRSRNPSFKLPHGLKPLSSLTSIPALVSPYTAPSATASTSNIAALASNQMAYPFPVVPAQPQAPGTPSSVTTFSSSQSPKPAKIDEEASVKESEGDDGDGDDSDSENEDATIHFGTNNKTQKEVESKIKSLKLNQPKDIGADLWEVMTKLTGGGKVVFPHDPQYPDRLLLEAKYKIFLDQAESQRRYRAMVDEVEEKIANSPRGHRY